MSLKTIFNIAFVAVLVLACEEKQAPKSVPDITKEESSDFNKAVNKDVMFMIDDYINAHGWQVEETGTGVKYMIYKHGEGMNAEPGLIALINFELTLLDGTVCYSSEVSGPKSFKISQADLESGLLDAILKMHVGDKAKIIMPHFRAHGLVGDFKKIPPLSPVIYDVELKALSER